MTEIPDVQHGFSSASFNPKNGRLLAAARGGGLFEYDAIGGWSELEMNYPKPLNEFMIDAAPDGTIYAYASERERQATGPIVERWLLHLNLEEGTSEIIAQYDRQGCCTLGNFEIDPQGYIWWILNPENLLFRVDEGGEMTLFAKRLPQDSQKAVTNDQGDVYLSSIIGVIRMHKEP